MNIITNAQPEFTAFPKMGRLHRETVITEKLDGTNAQIFITDSLDIFFGSRTRWITPQADNYGFARWGEGNKQELLKIGPGRHYGEWWGNGIQRGYGQKEKILSLFNVSRFVEYGNDPKTVQQKDLRLPAKIQEVLPECVRLVPILSVGVFSEVEVSRCMERLKTFGSVAAPGFMDPEGIIVYHTAAGVGFKKTIHGDDGKHQNA